MLAVANLAGTKWLSPWVIFCAVACIGVGIGTGASVDKDIIAEVSGQIHVLLLLSFLTSGEEGVTRKRTCLKLEVDVRLVKEGALVTAKNYCLQSHRIPVSSYISRADERDQQSKHILWCSLVHIIHGGEAKIARDVLFASAISQHACDTICCKPYALIPARWKGSRERC